MGFKSIAGWAPAVSWIERIVEVMKEIKMEELLAKAFEEIAKQEYENRPQDLPQHKFSLRFHCKMHWALWKAKQRKAKQRNAGRTGGKSTPLTVLYSPIRHKKRIAVIAVVLLFTGSIALSADSVFHFIFDRAIERNKDYMGVVYEEWEDHKEGEFQKYEITDVPEGYALEREEFDEEFQIYQVYYINENKQMLYFNQGWQEDGMIGNVTSGVNSAEEVNINGYSGYYLSDNNINTVVFSDGTYLLELSGGLPRKTMLEIAENLKLRTE